MRDEIFANILNPFYILALLLVIAVFCFSNFSSAANLNGTNFKNVTVHTNVNITNSKPEVLFVVVYQDSNSSMKNITLNAGQQRTVTCNASLRDWNSYSDIYYVNATLWDSANSQYSAADDNNMHYTNVNCSNAGNGLNYTVNYICNFSVYYYANNGTWVCNVTAEDQSNTTGFKSNTTLISPIYSLNITDGINYGSAAVEDYTANSTANVTNFGNMAINVTVEGYGNVRGDGLAMNCSLGGNITVDNERFSLQDTDWSSKTVLSSSPQLIGGLVVQKQTLSTTLMTNSTYWQMFINSSNNPGGNCSGYVIFSAVAP